MSHSVTRRPLTSAQYSRDATSLSKKITFLLHRIVNEDSPDDDDVLVSHRAAQQVHAKLREVQALFACMKHELHGNRFWRYHSQVSPSLQEYIEALSFAHYLEHGSLISLDQVQRSLGDEDGVVRMEATVAHLLMNKRVTVFSCACGRLPAGFV